MIFLDYVMAGAAGVALGTEFFPRFLRRFVKFQYVRMLKEDERERKRDLRVEHELYSDPVEPLDMDPRDVPPPVDAPPAVGTHARTIYEFGPARGTDVFPPPGPGEPQHMLERFEKLEKKLEYSSKWAQSARQKREFELLKEELQFHKQKFYHAQEILKGLESPKAVIAPEVEVEAIYEAGSKEPVAYVRVADGAQVEQMLCPDCYMGYEWNIVAKHFEPGSVPDQVPEDAPKCKHCNGKGKIPVTRMP